VPLPLAQAYYRIFFENKSFMQPMRRLMHAVMRGPDFLYGGRGWEGFFGYFLLFPGGSQRFLKLFPKTFPITPMFSINPLNQSPISPPIPLVN